MRQLQALLNTRLHPSLGLIAHGHFDAFTHEAVLRFQYARGLKTDGIVGPRTWGQLLLCEPGECSSEPIPGPGNAARPNVSPRAPRPDQRNLSVADWSLARRFQEVLLRTIPHLPSRLAAQLRAMLTPEGLAMFAGIMAGFAVAQFFGVGEVADAALVIWLGLDVAEDLLDAVTATVNARTIGDLDDAAGHVAHAIVVAGTALILLRLARGGQGGGGAGAAAEGEAAAASEADAAATRSSTPSRTATAAEESTAPVEPSEPPVAESERPPTTINRGRQNIHTRGTNEFETRSRSPRGGQSTWRDGVDPDALTQEAYENGDVIDTHPDGSPRRIQYDTDGRVVGEQGETSVTVHRTQDSRIHGHPSGPRTAPSGGGGG